MTVLTEWAQPNTDHGLLVAFGEFFQQHGLLQYLLRVPIRQKTRDLTPPAKLEVAVLGRAAVAPQRVTFEGPNGRLAGLVANSVHWCMPCLRTCVAEPTPTTNRTLSSPKHMVRVAANSPALVQQSVKGTALQFSPASALPGVTLILRGIPAFQLPLSFQEPFKIASQTTNQPWLRKTYAIAQIKIFTPAGVMHHYRSALQGQHALIRAAAGGGDMFAAQFANLPRGKVLTSSAQRQRPMWTLGGRSGPTR